MNVEPTQDEFRAKIADLTRQLSTAKAEAMERQEDAFYTGKHAGHAEALAEAARFLDMEACAIACEGEIYVLRKAAKDLRAISQSPRPESEDTDAR